MENNNIEVYGKLVPGTTESAVINSEYVGDSAFYSAHGKKYQDEINEYLYNQIQSGSGSGGSSDYVLPAATSSALGGIKTGYTTSGKNYKVLLDSSNNAYVNVPWSDTNTTYSIATSSTAGLVRTGYTENGKNYPVELNASGQMYVNVPWAASSGGGTADSVDWDDITNKPSFATVATSGSYGDLLNKPVSTIELYAGDNLVNGTDNKGWIGTPSIQISDALKVLPKLRIIGAGHIGTAAYTDADGYYLLIIDNIDIATTTSAGLMSASDKLKLNSLSSGGTSGGGDLTEADRETLDLLTSYLQDGIVTGVTTIAPVNPTEEGFYLNFNICDDSKCAIKAITIPLASSSKDGLMSSEDKAKLDSLSDTGDVELPSYLQTGTMVSELNLLSFSGTTLTVGTSVIDLATGRGNSKTKTVTIPTATTSAAGLMSASDKEKLNNLTTGSGSGGGDLTTADRDLLDRLSSYDSFVLDVNEGSFTADDSDGYNFTVNVCDSTKCALKTLTIPYASTTEGGLITSSDKVKLNSLTTAVKEINAFDYTASSRVLRISAATQDFANTTGSSSIKQVTLPLATSSAAGLMSNAHYNKLSAIGNIISNVQASSSLEGTLTLTFTRDNVEDDSSSSIKAQIPVASTSVAGLMSIEDKKKLNSLTQSSGEDFDGLKIYTVSSSGSLTDVTTGGSSSVGYGGGVALGTASHAIPLKVNSDIAQAAFNAYSDSDGNGYVNLNIPTAIISEYTALTGGMLTQEWALNLALLLYRLTLDRTPSSIYFNHQLETALNHRLDVTSGFDSSWTIENAQAKGFYFWPNAFYVDYLTKNNYSTYGLTTAPLCSAVIIRPNLCNNSMSNTDVGMIVGSDYRTIYNNTHSSIGTPDINAIGNEVMHLMHIAGEDNDFNDVVGYGNYVLYVDNGYLQLVARLFDSDSNVVASEVCGRVPLSSLSTVSASLETASLDTESTEMATSDDINDIFA